MHNRFRKPSLSIATLTFVNEARDVDRVLFQFVTRTKGPKGTMSRPDARRDDQEEDVVDTCKFSSVHVRARGYPATSMPVCHAPRPSIQFTSRRWAPLRRRMRDRQ